MEPVVMLRLPAVIARTGLSRTTIYQEIALGHFPKPAQLSARAVGWASTAIDGWIAERLATPATRHPAAA